MKEPKSLASKSESPKPNSEKPAATAETKKIATKPLMTKVVESKVLLGTFLFTALGVVFLFMAGFFTPKLSEEKLTNSVQNNNIETVLLEEKEVQKQREFTATVIADQKAVLAARLTAKIAEVLVDVGAQVKKGDILIRLESTDLNARVNQTEQALSSTQSQLNIARKEYNRSKALLGKKLISQSDFDRADLQLKTANANFKQAKATVKEAETTFGFSIITAPFDGIISERSINAGDTATPGMNLLSLYNPKTLQLKVNISESLLNKATLGTLLNYQIPSFNIKAQGNIVEVSPATDSTSRSFLLKVSLENTPQLYPGTFATVWVDSELTKQLIVPQKAIYQIGQLDYVKVLEAGKVKTKLIQFGDNYVVRKGLKVGDKVLLDPLKNLK